MTISAFDGPLVTFPALNVTGLVQSNPEGGPSLLAHGFGLEDIRNQYTYIPGSNFSKPVYGWLNGGYQTIDQVPYTATTNNIAAAQTAVANTALSLVTASATGITAGVTIVRADTGATVTGLLAIDGAMTSVGYGSAKTVNMWDPTTAISRALKITSNGTDTGVFTVKGYDIYAFPMSEVITGTTGTATTSVAVIGNKAWKYISSITPSGTINSTGLLVGTSDTIGLPLRADRWTELSMQLGNTAVTVGTGFTAAVTTGATTTSGDVRGTYTLQTASNGVSRFVVKQSPLPANSSTTAGITGVNQA